MCTAPAPRTLTVASQALAFLQACKKLPALRTILDKHPDVTPKYLTRRVKEVCPWFKFGPRVLDAEFSEEKATERIQWCFGHLGWEEEDWKRVVFIDECSVLMLPEPQPSFVRRGTVLADSDPRQRHHRYGAPHLNFTMAVNAYMGLVYLDYNSQSTGFKGPKFVVSPSPNPCSPKQHPFLSSEAALSIAYKTSPALHTTLSLWLLLLNSQKALASLALKQKSSGPTRVGTTPASQAALPKPSANTHCYWPFMPCQPLAACAV